MGNNSLLFFKTIVCCSWTNSHNLFRNFWSIFISRSGIYAQKWYPEKRHVSYRLIWKCPPPRAIVPILNYGAEVWRYNEWHQIEKLHLLAYKYTLGVNNWTPTDGVHAELWRYPLHIDRKITMIKYLKRLENLSDSRLIKKAFNQQLQDDRQGHYNWFSQINTIKTNLTFQQSNQIII